jgi:hypothetical protein
MVKMNVPRTVLEATRATIVRRVISTQRWRTICGRRLYFRSNWEYRYALYLQYLKDQGKIKEWEHEPRTFWFEAIKRGVRSYLPDFKVTSLDDTHFWVEVKGYMDAKSNTKIKRFKKYYPDEKLVVMTGDWFKKNDWKIDAFQNKMDNSQPPV